MERVRFITHQDKRVLLIDHSDSSAAEMLKTLEQAESVIGSQSAGSVLVLCDFSGAQVDKLAADRMKVVATKDRPYVLRAALVHGENIPDVYYRALCSFSGREFPKFTTREQALDWLTAEEEQRAAS